ncbi:hypothetical protein P5673_009363 [Acropora cervicornis]|uniref:Uncharacterized protein n=1 Tax=Acropora cervicornis TaxID=6130 RepID=A0AAD9QSF0_ACRCE|nr:hypothetical protein P5673_009363 [Acropora cervicornis]
MTTDADYIILSQFKAAAPSYDPQFFMQTSEEWFTSSITIRHPALLAFVNNSQNIRQPLQTVWGKTTV